MLTETQKIARKSGVGGSDVSSIMSLPPYGCARRLWYDKRGFPEDYPVLNNKHLERGHGLEPLARRIFEKETGFKVKQVDQLTSKQHPFMLCNLDGLIFDENKGGRGVLEIKCPARENYIRFKKDGVQEGHILQMQHNMEVWGLDWGMFFIFNADLWDWVPFEVKKDEKLLEMVIEKEDAFWKLVIDKTMPEQLEVGDKRCKKCTYRLTCLGQLSELDEAFDVEDDEIPDLSDNEDFCKAVEDYVSADEIYKEAKVLKKDAGTRLKDIIGKKQVVKGGRAMKVIYRTNSVKSWNTDLLRNDFPEDSDFAKKYQMTLPKEYFLLRKAR